MECYNSSIEFNDWLKVRFMMILTLVLKLHITGCLIKASVGLDQSWIFLLCSSCIIARAFSGLQWVTSVRSPELGLSIDISMGLATNQARTLVTSYRRRQLRARCGTGQGRAPDWFVRTRRRSWSSGFESSPRRSGAKRNWQSGKQIGWEPNSTFQPIKLVFLSRSSFS